MVHAEKHTIRTKFTLGIHKINTSERKSIRLTRGWLEVKSVLGNSKKAFVRETYLSFRLAVIETVRDELLTVRFLECCTVRLVDGTLLDGRGWRLVGVNDNAWFDGKGCLRGGVLVLHPRSHLNVLDVRFRLTRKFSDLVESDPVRAKL